MRLLIGLSILVGCSTSEATNNHHSDEAAAVEAMRNLLNHRLTENGQPININTAALDLNSDGINEAIAYISGEGACGSGGCDLYILQKKKGVYEPITRMTITWPPIRVLESKSNGWHDLAVWVQGGGILPGYEARLRFDGVSYPSNPSLVPPENGGSAPGRVVISRSSPGTPLDK